MSAFIHKTIEELSAYLLQSQSESRMYFQNIVNAWQAARSGTLYSTLIYVLLWFTVMLTKAINYGTAPEAFSGTQTNDTLGFDTSWKSFKSLWEHQFFCRSTRCCTSVGRSDKKSWCSHIFSHLSRSQATHSIDTLIKHTVDSFRVHLSYHFFNMFSV